VGSIPASRTIRDNGEAWFFLAITPTALIGVLFLVIFWWLERAVGFISSRINAQILDYQ
jgi:hypothetical protein